MTDLWFFFNISGVDFALILYVSREKGDLKDHSVVLTQKGFSGIKIKQITQILTILLFYGNFKWLMVNAVRGFYS